MSGCSPDCAQDVITTDFCYDFLQFRHEGVTLRLPGGLSIDLMKYWDGQPVRFVCCERRSDGTRGPGRSFWCVQFEVVPDGEDEDEGSEESI